MVDKIAPAYQPDNWIEGPFWYGPVLIIRLETYAGYVQRTPAVGIINHSWIVQRTIAAAVV